MFSLFKPKCGHCGMKLKDTFYELQGKKFCCEDCKRNYRHKMRADKGESCH
ncbi:MAG: hypothetical protein QW156_02995 [Candidatus Aenigmatarchaeota archaeon]